MALTVDPLAQYVEKVKAANALGLKIKSAKSNQDDNVKAILENSDDPKVVKFREAKSAILEQIETLQAKITNGEANIRQHALTLIPGVDPNFDVEKASKEFAGLRKDVTQHRKALEMFVSSEALTAALKEMDVPELMDLRGSGSHSTKPAGETKRPRISAATVDGESVWTDKDKTKVNFTTLAQHVKMSADDVKKAAFAAAETDDLNSLAAGTVVSFTVGEGENSHAITVTISAAKPGRKPKETSETETQEKEK